MQSLPSELKHFIIELSSGSPNSLAALARTHTSFQREAEKALYDTIYIFSGDRDSLKCMETLATNPKKAALVHSLIIESSRYDKIENQTVTTYLSKSLINMHSLSDFRVRSRPGEMKGLPMEKILCGGHFQLHTLYSSDVRNISQIIKSQTTLQILGLYISRSGLNVVRSTRHILKILKELHNAQSFFPIIVTLVHASFALPYAKEITIFPMFYPVDRRATIPHVLAQSFGKDQGINTVASVDNVCGVSIYMIDSSDKPSISALAKNMAVSFPQISGLYLCFERWCDIPPQEIKDEFSFFSNLRDVNTFFL